MQIHMIKDANILALSVLVRLAVKLLDIPQELVMKMTNVGALRMTTISFKMSENGWKKLIFQKLLATNSINFNAK